MSDPFVAEIRMFGCNFAPRGWAFCNGQLLPISQNTALFSLVGTYYGGDGRSTFALPDLQGRVPVGTGQGPGLTPRDLGESGGSYAVTLISSEIPVHTHSGAAVASDADRSNASNNVRAKPADAVYATSPPTGALPAAALGVAGGSQPHNNLQPYRALNFVIALQGIFPPRQ